MEIFAASIVAVCILVALIMYRDPVTRLMDRLKSGELAGVKFDFADRSVAHFLRGNVDAIAEEVDGRRRQILAENVKSFADTIGAVHPLSLVLLIEASQSSHTWIGDAFTTKKSKFDEIERLGLATINHKVGTDGKLNFWLELTENGEALIHAIGLDVHKYPRL